MATQSLLSTRLASRSTVITGASSGLGRAIALAFAANGACPIICTDLRSDPRGEWGADEPGVPTHDLINRRYGEGKAVFVQGDATVAADVERAVKKAVELGGRLDVKVNSRSVFLGCKYAVAQFLSQPPHASGHRGWIVNTASMVGLVGLKPTAAAYCASKGAVVLLTKQIAVEYGIDKIHCNALCPGYLKTPMTAPIYDDEKTRKGIDAMTPWGEWGSADDVAKCAVFLASDDAAYVTGVSSSSTSSVNS
ncbi:MAG: hypothetical protein Q9177_004612, partial [Variospora cf. flavescens]